VPSLGSDWIYEPNGGKYYEVNKDILKGRKIRWAHELSAFGYLPYICIANRYKRIVNPDFF